MLTKREVILAKIEATYKTDAAPTAADGVMVENLSSGLEGLRMHERNPVGVTLAPQRALYGGHLKSVTFDVLLKGSGTAGTAPEFGPLLRAAGMSETVVAVTSVTYAPVSDTADQESVTIYYYQDGKLHKLTGAMCTALSFSADAGGPGRVTMTFAGHHAESDATMVTPTLDATVPPVFKDAAFAVDSYSAIISSLSFGLGLSTAMPPDVSAADGFGQLRITGRNVTGGIDPEATLKATYDWLDKLQGTTTGALDTGTVGATAGNIWRVQQPAVYYTNVADGDRDGIRTHDISISAIESSGDDEVQIIFQ